MSQVTSLAITVVGHDRPGIIAQAAEILAGCGMNLEDSSMTLLRGHFAMTLICAGDAEATRVEAALQPLADGSLDVTVREVPSDHDQRPFGDPIGHGARSRPARIVARLTGVIAEAGGNITDLTTRLSGGLYVLLAEVDLPASARGGRAAGAAGRGVRRARRRRRTATAGERRAVSLSLPELPEGRVLEVVRAPSAVLSARGPTSTRPTRRSSSSAPIWWRPCKSRPAASGWRPLRSGWPRRRSVSTFPHIRRPAPSTV